MLLLAPATPRSNRRPTSPWLGVAALAALIVVGLIVSPVHRARARAPGTQARPTVVTIGSSPVGPAIPRDFVGFSLEFRTVPAYVGTDPRRPDPVFAQLIRNVDPGGSPVLRIGGDSTDATWWPVRGMRRPQGVSYSLTPRWLATTRSLADALRARLILGVNLRAGNFRLSLAEAHAMLRHIGGRHIAALEIGNEPGLYGRFPYYRVHGRAFYARRPGYGMHQFTREFSALAARLPGVPLAGPTLEGPPSSAELSRFLSAEPSVRIATLHRYPLNSCFPSPSSPRFATVPNLLAPFASAGLVASLGDAVEIARQAGRPMRIDELNSVSCSGKRGISDTFAAALWGLDELFGMARDGVAGINIHTFARAVYAPFAFAHTGQRWSASVRPMYYGLLAFAAAAPPGARLEPVSVQSDPNLSVWATRGRDERLRVVLINKGVSRSALIHLSVGPAHSPIARVARLLAPSAFARTGITLGGQSFGRRTSSGRLQGRPRLTDIHATGTAFALRIPPASAAIVTMRLLRAPRTHA